MLVRSAILKAAKLFETKPRKFQFFESTIPSSTRTPCGCALGWIGFFLGHRNTASLDDVARDITGHGGPGKFYTRMLKLTELLQSDKTWHHSADSRRKVFAHTPPRIFRRASADRGL